MSENSKSIIFVRHAESEANNVFHVTGSHIPSADTPLTKLGQEQAKATALHLERCFRNTSTHVKVWTSPFVRTQQTAEPFIECASDLIIDTVIIQDSREYTSHKKSQLNESFAHASWYEFINQLRKFIVLIKATYQAMNDNE